MRLKTFFTIFIVGITVFIASCKKDMFKPVTNICPLILETNPPDGATGVPLNKVITVTFNKEMDSASITDLSFVVSGSVVAGMVSYENKVATFTPVDPLLENHTYVGYVKTTVKDYTGNHLQEEFSWTFSTGLVIVPIVLRTSPVNLESDVDLNKTLTATFSTPMRAGSVDSSFKLMQGANQVAGIFSYSDSTASFKPSMPLLEGTSYTATIAAGASNTEGEKLQNDYEWTFSTKNITAPTVVSTSPLNNETDVALNKIISATFSDLMRDSTVSSASFIVKLGTMSVSGMVNTVGKTAFFQPLENLISGETYTATITQAVKSADGIPMSMDYTWTFDTKEPLGPLAPELNGVAAYGIIAGTAVSNNAGFSVINNLDVGLYPGVRSSITGFPPATIVNGSIHAADDVTPVGIAAELLQAKTDLTSAYLYAEGASLPAPTTVSGDQGGKTLAPGIYKTTSTLLIQNGDLTLDAQGDVNAVWIFQIASTLTTVGGAGGDVILSGGAQAKNIYWQIGSSATLGGYTIFKGNILALTTITMGGYSVADGRMLAQNGAVSMVSTNTINKP